MVSQTTLRLMNKQAVRAGHKHHKSARVNMSAQKVQQHAVQLALVAQLLVVRQTPAFLILISRFSHAQFRERSRQET